MIAEISDNNSRRNDYFPLSFCSAQGTLLTLPRCITISERVPSCFSPDSRTVRYTDIGKRTHESTRHITNPHVTTTDYLIAAPNRLSSISAVTYPLRWPRGRGRQPKIFFVRYKLPISVLLTSTATELFSKLTSILVCLRSWRAFS